MLRNYQVCLEVQKHEQHVLLPKNVMFLVVGFEWFSLNRIVVKIIDTFFKSY